MTQGTIQLSEHFSMSDKPLERLMRTAIEYAIGRTKDFEAGHNPKLTRWACTLSYLIEQELTRLVRADPQQSEGVQVMTVLINEPLVLHALAHRRWVNGSATICLWPMRYVYQEAVNTVFVTPHSAHDGATMLSEILRSEYPQLMETVTPLLERMKHIEVKNDARRVD